MQLVPLNTRLALLNLSPSSLAVDEDSIAEIEEDDDSL
jgi:hypothetical protein